MLRNFNEWVHATRGRRCAVGSVCVLAIVAGLGMATRHLLRPEPPDAKAAPVAEVLAFLTSERFAALDSQTRQDYLARFGSRYARMSDAERRAVEAQWKASGMDKGTRRRIEEQFGLSMARQVIERYQSLPPEARGAYLDQVAATMRVMQMGTKGVEPWVEQANPVARSMRSHESFSRDIAGFKRDLVNQTSAPERAAIAEVGRELLVRLRDPRLR